MKTANEKGVCFCVRRVTRVSVLLALSLLITGGALVSAAGFVDRGQIGSSGLGVFRRGIDRLDLAIEQQQELLRIRREHAPQILDLKLEFQQKMLELRQLWNADELDEETIAQKAGEVAALRVRLRKAEQAFAEEERQVLTPEQLEKLEQSTKQPMRRLIRRFGPGEPVEERMRRNSGSVRPYITFRGIGRGIRIPDFPNPIDLVNELYDKLGISFDDKNEGRLWRGFRYEL